MNGLVIEGLELPSEEFTNQMQSLRRRDLLAWLARLFPHKGFDDKRLVLADRLADGVVLCQLAKLVQPEAEIACRDDPQTDADKQHNIQQFLSFGKSLGLADEQLFQPTDLQPSQGDAQAMDADAKDQRLVQALLSVGLLSNQLDKCPEKLQVEEVVEMEEQDRQLRSARIQKTMQQKLADKKISLRRMDKQKSTRLSLMGGSVPELEGADEMTPEQLAQLHQITGGQFGVPQGGKRPARSLALNVPDNNKRLSKLPPQLDRAKEGNKFELGIAVLAKDISASEITLVLNKPPPFASTDVIKVNSELMEVKGVMENTVMVSRGVLGSVAEAHPAGSTVTHQNKEDGDMEEVGEYEVLRNRAMEEEFEDLDDMDFLELLEDVSGSMTFVFIVSERYRKFDNLDAKGKHNDERLLAYLINRLELVVSHQYSILYFHSAKPEHHLEFTFLSKAYRILSREYKANLENMWIVHPTFWVKTAFFFCSPFMDASVAARVIVCESVENLYEHFDKDGLPLPQVVMRTEEERKGAWF